MNAPAPKSKEMATIAQGAKAPPLASVFSRERFFAEVQKFLSLSQQNVIGMNYLLSYAEEHHVPLPDLAYVLATAWWESGHTLWPVREAFWKSESWRKKNLRYWPFYGRGLIQVTWKANYAKLGKALGVDFVKNPDLLLQWQYALPALFEGMRKGLYTGRKLDDFIDDKNESKSVELAQYEAARMIVNGTDRAKTIADMAFNLRGALGSARYGK